MKKIKDIVNDAHDPKFYDIRTDFERFPDVTYYAVWSRRGPGKTFSLLRYCYVEGIKPLYIKRRNDDIDMLCNDEDDETGNPYKPLNDMFGTNIRIIKKKRKKGQARIVEFDDEGNELRTIGHVLSLAAVSKLKGFDFQDPAMSIVCFDEFIPMAGEIVRKAEGDMFYNLLKTVERARQDMIIEDPSIKPLKVVLFANAESPVSPITTTNKWTDDIVEMYMKGEDVRIIRDGCVMLHNLQREFALSEERISGIDRGMKGTKAYKKAVGGEFLIDVSNIKNVSIKGYKCLVHISYNEDDWYVYQHRINQTYHVCRSPHKCDRNYDFDRDVDLRRYLAKENITFREAIIRDKMTFESYTMYDTMINFVKRFDL